MKEEQIIASQGNFIFRILTPKGKVFEQEVYSVLFPGIDGEFAILENHSPLVAGLKEGLVKIHDESFNIIRLFYLKQAYVEFKDNEASLLADAVCDISDYKSCNIQDEIDQNNGDRSRAFTLLRG